MRNLKESLLDIDDNINDDSILYYDILKKSYGKHRLDSKLKKEIMDESKKVIFNNQASKYNVNKYKLLLIRAREPFSYLNYEYYDAICVSHGNGCVSYIDFGEERFMKTMDKIDFYTMLFDSNEGYFAGEDIEVRGIMHNSKLVKDIAKALEIMDSKL